MNETPQELRAIAMDDDLSSYQRRRAFEELVKTPDYRDDAEMILDLLAAADRSLRGDVVRAMTRSGDPAFHLFLAKALDDPDDYVKRDALLGLEACADPVVAECVEKLAATAGLSLKSSAERTLDRIRTNIANTPEPEPEPVPEIEIEEAPQSEPEPPPVPEIEEAPQSEPEPPPVPEVEEAPQSEPEPPPVPEVEEAPTQDSDTARIPAGEILAKVPREVLVKSAEALNGAYKGNPKYVFTFKKRAIMDGLAVGHVELPTAELVAAISLPVFKSHAPTFSKTLTLPLEAIVPHLPCEWILNEHLDHSKVDVVKEMADLFEAKETPEPEAMAKPEYYSPPNEPPPIPKASKKRLSKKRRSAPKENGKRHASDKVDIEIFKEDVDKAIRDYNASQEETPGCGKGCGIVVVVLIFLFIATTMLKACASIFG